MGNFFDANYNVTKIRTSGGDIVELELNNKPVTLTAKLLCFKYSSSYLYTKAIPAEDKTGATVYTGGAIAKTTADYNVEKKTDCWTFDSKYFGSDMAQLEGAPDGTAGTPVALGNYIWASNKKFYVEDSSKFYEVLDFGKTAETMVISEDEVTDETLLAELEAATAKALAYVLYTLNAGFTYSSHHYERYATGDVTIE